MALIVNTAVYAEILNDLRAAKKIAAIKRLRSSNRLDLRTAKLAIERLQHEKFSGHYPHAASEGRPIVPGPLVREIVVDWGTGPMTIDIEAMELKALSQLEAVGLEACGSMLDLCHVIKAWSQGKRVGVLEEE